MKHLTLTILIPAILLLSIAAQAQLPADAVWIDVRTPGEFADGHLQGATLIPFDRIEAGVLELGLDRDAPIYLYCGSGKRAEKARQSLEREGYTRVTNVGGLDDALELSGRPRTGPM